MSPFIYIMSASVLTFILRLLPYIFMDHIHITPYIKRIIDYLPIAVMSILVVYCFKDVILTGQHLLATIIGVTSVIVIHVIKKNTILSIVFGTIIYMVCLQLI